MQGQFNFDASGNDQGYTQWLAGRRVAVAELARRINLPLGHQVEVWLCGGVRLRGRLRLAEELLFIDEERLRHLELIRQTGSHIVMRLDLERDTRTVPVPNYR